MSIIAFRRSGFGQTTLVDANQISCPQRVELITNDGADFDAHDHAMFVARCQQVVALRLTNAAQNSVFAQLRQMPKRRKLLCA